MCCYLSIFANLRLCSQITYGGRRSFLFLRPQKLQLEPIVMNVDDLNSTQKVGQFIKARTSDTPIYASVKYSYMWFSMAPYFVKIHHFMSYHSLLSLQYSFNLRFVHQQLWLVFLYSGVVVLEIRRKGFRGIWGYFFIW